VTRRIRHARSARVLAAACTVSGIVCLAAALVAAAGGASGDTAPRHAADEWIDPAYNVVMPPGGIVALDASADRFAVEVLRRERSSTVTSVHLALTIRGRGAVVGGGEHRAAIADGRHALVSVPAPMSPWTILANGRLAAFVRAWEYGGFQIDAEVREGGPGGRLVYRLHDPAALVRISRRGFFDRYGLTLCLAGLAAALLASYASARLLGGTGWRVLFAFDVAALATIAALAAAFTRYLLVSWWPAVFVLPFTPSAMKRRAMGTAARAWPWNPAAPEPLGRTSGWTPALAAAALTAWLTAWHHVLIAAMGFRPADFREHLSLLAALYLALSLALVMPLHHSLARRAARGRRLWAPVAVAGLAAALVVAARALDWGTFFFSAGHVDEDFWAHAFYGQVLGLGADPTVRLLAGAALLSTALAGLLLWRAVAFARRSRAWSLGPGGQTVVGAVLRANAAWAAAGVLAASAAWPVIQAPSGRDLSDSVREAFAGVPEYKVAASLLRTLAPRLPARMPAIDEAFAAKLERAGIRLGSIDPAWPLMKPSIYLDPASASAVGRPRVPAGTNLIVILGESLSAALVDEAVHGIPGLTPAIDDFRRSAFTFRSLYSADFPTIKGELATLASFAFDHRGLPITADSGNPLKSRYLFLSDVLGEHGYSSYHLQSDFASFAGTASILGRHGYQRIYAAEDPELRRRARHPIQKTWGLYDEDLFTAVADLIDEGQFRQPFLLTVATTDLHFPYAALRRHPGTGGSALLDAVHSGDAAFGSFWERFKRSSRARDTLVLLTADHALVRRHFTRGGAVPTRSQFDYVLASLYVPGDPAWAGGGTDTTCTQLDLAPTLLDVLGLDTPNPFLGLSIFSERPRFPLALAREIPWERWTAAERAAVQAIGWTDADHRRWLDLLRHLAVTDRVMPPGRPAAARPRSRRSRAPSARASR